MQLFYAVITGLGGMLLAGVGILFFCGGLTIAFTAFQLR